MRAEAACLVSEAVIMVLLLIKKKEGSKRHLGPKAGSLPLASCSMYPASQRGPPLKCTFPNVLI